MRCSLRGEEPTVMSVPAPYVCPFRLSLILEFLFGFFFFVPILLLIYVTLIECLFLSQLPLFCRCFRLCFVVLPDNLECFWCCINVSLQW